MRHPTDRPHPGTAVAPASSPLQSPPSANLNRRRFLVSLGASGAGVAAAVASLPAAAAAVTSTAPAEAAGSGYRETNHVRNYYRTCKL
jgi:hypothetical protein